MYEWEMGSVTIVLGIGLILGLLAGFGLGYAVGCRSAVTRRSTQRGFPVQPSRQESERASNQGAIHLKDG
jgi:hypothetical protein